MSISFPVSLQLLTFRSMITGHVIGQEWDPAQTEIGEVVAIGL